MKIFDHYETDNINSACGMLSAYGGSMKPIAGGTDLITVLKADILPQFPEAVLDLKGISGLNNIYEKDGFLHIGAMAVLRDITETEVVKLRYPALAEAADKVASPQIRNIATIGGNLCQDTRCWYYRYPAKLGGGPIICPRKGGKGACLAIRGDNRYHAILNGRRCFAVCPSDTAVALAALNANLIIAGVNDERKIAMKDFYNPLGNALENGELVREIEIPSINMEYGQSFIKYAHRASIDFALVSAAAVIAVNDGFCTAAQFALGAVAPGPVRPEEAEKYLIGKEISTDTAAKAADIALANAVSLSMNGYKVDIAKAVLKRTILDAAAKCK